jgi:hypothetical protein
MRPVWIKYYGLIPMTRRGYLITTGIAFLFAAIACAIVFGLAIAHDRMPPFNRPGPPPPGAPQTLGSWLYYNAYWCLLLLLIAEGLDILVTLRAFAKKEAEERARFMKERFDAKLDAADAISENRRERPENRLYTADPRSPNSATGPRDQYYLDPRNPG